MYGYNLKNIELKIGNIFDEFYKAQIFIKNKRFAILKKQIDSTWDVNVKTLVLMLNFENNIEYYMRNSMIIDTFYKLLASIEAFYNHKLKDEIRKIESIKKFLATRKRWIHPFDIWEKKKANDNALIAQYKDLNTIRKTEIIIATEEFKNNKKIRSDFKVIDLEKLVAKCIVDLEEFVQNKKNSIFSSNNKNPSKK